MPAGRPPKFDWTAAIGQAEAGHTDAEIAASVGCSVAYVRAWAKSRGVTVVRAPRQKKREKPAARQYQPQMTYPRKPSERAMQMATMYRQGLTLQTIGDHFGLTRERVRQIIRGIGVLSAEGGIAKKAIQQRVAKRSKTAGRVMLRWGVSLDDWRVCKANKMVTRFTRQRQNAYMRNIDWRLTFVEWKSIWDSSGKYELCGRGTGHYCMSRIKDSGAYAVGNVHIQLFEQNSSEGFKKARLHTKANKGVYHVLPGRTNAWLAKVGKKRLGYFPSESAAVAARQAELAA